MFINTSKVIIPYQSNYGNIIKSKGADQAKMLYCADFIKNKAPLLKRGFLCALCGSFRKVACIELIVFAFLSNKIIVASAFNDSAMLKYHNTVCIFNG